MAARLLFGRIEEGATSGVAVAGWERGEGAALPLVLGPFLFDSWAAGGAAVCCLPPVRLGVGLVAVS